MSTDVQKYEATVKRDEKERVIMKLTEQILDLEEKKIKQKEQEISNDANSDYGEKETGRNRSTPPASSTLSDLSKRVGNALFILKSKAKQRPKLQDELYDKIKTKMEYNMLVSLPLVMLRYFPHLVT